jgi:hypothetical protein
MSVRNSSKPVWPYFDKYARARTVAVLAAPLLIAATPVTNVPEKTVSATAPVAQAVSAEPPGSRDRGEIAGWLGLSACIGFVIVASRRRNREATAA